MANLQVKGLDDRLYKALGARAALDNRSISQQVVTIIETFLAQHQTAPRRATLAFLELAGTWEDDRSAKAIADDLRRSRRNKSRTKRLEDVFT